MSIRGINNTEEASETNKTSKFLMDYIITCYYEDKYLDRALSALSKQTFKDSVNVIVVNDHSPNTPDEYRSTIDKYRDQLSIKVVTNKENLGPGLSFQVGIDNCETAFFMIQDDDDWVEYPKALEEMYNAIKIKIDESIAFLGVSGVTKTINLKTHKEYLDHKRIHGTIFNRALFLAFNIRYTPNVTWAYDDIYLMKVFETLESVYKLKMDIVGTESYIYITNRDEAITCNITESHFELSEVLTDIELEKYKYDNGINVSKEEQARNRLELINKTYELLRNIIYNSEEIVDRDWEDLKRTRKLAIELDRLYGVNIREYIDSRISKHNGIIETPDYIINSDIVGVYYSEQNEIYNSSIDSLRTVVESLKKSNKIDYIINCTRESEVISRGLEALCNQTAKNCLNVILISNKYSKTDCNYQDLIDKYSKKLNISVLRTDKDSIGAARNFAIDNSNSKYIMFQDDDDYLEGNEYIDNVLKTSNIILTGNTVIAAVYTNIKQIDSINDISYTTDTDMFKSSKPVGILFNRDFIKSNNIRFNECEGIVDKEFINELISGISKNKDALLIKCNKDYYVYDHTDENSMSNSYGFAYANVESAINTMNELDNIEDIQDSIYLAINTVLLSKENRELGAVPKYKFKELCEKALNIKTNKDSYIRDTDSFELLGYSNEKLNEDYRKFIANTKEYIINAMNSIGEA